MASLKQVQEPPLVGEADLDESWESAHCSEHAVCTRPASRGRTAWTHLCRSDCKVYSQGFPHDAVWVGK